MASLQKGIWEQKQDTSYTSTESDTQSETEVNSVLNGWNKNVSSVGSLQANTTNGKNGCNAADESDLRGQRRRKRNGEERMPTRRPDPNVRNKNALYARENRRKKKLYMELLENELHDARKANSDLVKALKRQVKQTKKLEQEKRSLEEQKRYFQNSLAELSNRLTSDHKKCQETTDQTIQVVTNDSSPSCCSGSSYDPEPLQNPFGAASHDLDNDLGDGGISHSSWESIWNTSSSVGQINEGNDGESSPSASAAAYPQITTLGRDSMEDHNYMLSPAALDMPLLSETSASASSSSPSNSFSDEFQGVCSHLTRGKISLEFCPVCHINSSSPDPPLQLFNDEMLF